MILLILGSINEGNIRSGEDLKLIFAVKYVYNSLRVNNASYGECVCGNLLTATVDKNDGSEDDLVAVFILAGDGHCALG